MSLLAIAKSLTGQECCIALMGSRQILEGTIRGVVGKSLKIRGVRGKVPIGSIRSIVPVADGGKR